MGGGGDGFAFWIDNKFENGFSNSCETFDNNILTQFDSKFKLFGIQLWTFEDINNISN
jgi:hypothetical protein